MSTINISRRRLNLSDVCRLIGMGRRTAYNRMAEDIAAGTPGRSFPLPSERNIVRKVGHEWDSVAVESWLNADSGYDTGFPAQSGTRLHTVRNAGRVAS